MTKRIPKVGDWVKLNVWAHFYEVKQIEDDYLTVTSPDGLDITYLINSAWVFRDAEPTPINVTFTCKLTSDDPVVVGPGEYMIVATMTYNKLKADSEKLNKILEAAGLA